MLRRSSSEEVAKSSSEITEHIDRLKKQIKEERERAEASTSRTPRKKNAFLKRGDGKRAADQALLHLVKTKEEVSTALDRWLRSVRHPPITNCDLPPPNRRRTNRMSDEGSRLTRVSRRSRRPKRTRRTCTTVGGKATR